ncbi:hypothetical protein LY90DRAFT_501681 [Neocallimastix californiae]|uniref:Uncharacterized protein n=1 Tax=Neocallimastix californiae TaxID=1754190 RepID=A0A1Y2EYV7_9FUNG|nr:hypothetical protein LY90DRAFT_501681 [Neocallimastix californiae]|eukprot:ORY76812.1 hypothetical protein LY90DRAFT_501681 [Neocallimastix californiae]
MSLIQQTFPTTKTVITNGFCSMGTKLSYNVCTQKRLLSSNDNSDQKLNQKLIGKIKQSKIFNRKNKSTQYQSLRKEKKKSQKSSPPPSGSHPIMNSVIFIGGAAAFAFLFTGIYGENSFIFNSNNIFK